MASNFSFDFEKVTGQDALDLQASVGKPPEQQAAIVARIAARAAGIDLNQISFVDLPQLINEFIEEMTRYTEKQAQDIIGALLDGVDLDEYADTND